MVIVALGMVAFLGFLGLALDGASAYLERQNLQKAADLAAVSGSWAYYHAVVQESDGYGTVADGMSAANAAISSDFTVNGYPGVTSAVVFIDESGADLDTSACGVGGPSCPQPWVVRGVRVNVSKVLPTQVLQALGVGNPTIAAEARAEFGPNTGARHEAPLLLQNFSASNNLPRVNPYPAPCLSSPVDGYRYPLSPDCRPSTGRVGPAPRRSWTQGQPMSLEPAWGTTSPEVFPFDQPYAPRVRFFLLHDPSTSQPPASTVSPGVVMSGLPGFVPTCPPVPACPATSPVYADTRAPASDPVPAGMQARITRADDPAGKWAGQACATPHDTSNPLTPDNPRLVRLPVTYATDNGAADVNGVGSFRVSETVMFCVDSVPMSGGAYAVSGYLVEVQSAEPTVLRPGEPYFGRDVVVKLLS